ncbi:LysM peptidoglycan-binding domain-containing protein [Euzebya sp.]|uniref:lytic transglycosylase n=1 Tax=Euzebya sp. TaxID=1971409 RepID=UPI003517F628
MRQSFPTRRGMIVAVAGLTIVTGPTAASGYVVERGDTLSGIASRHGVSTAAVADANGLADPDLIVEGAVLVIPSGSGRPSAVTHVVAPGETLSHIAAMYGVSVSALAEANGIDDPDLIYSGRQIAVAGGAGGGGTTATPAATGGGGRAADRDEVRRLIVETAQRWGWRPAIPLGLAMQESGWNNTVVSSAGAIGIMQVLPATGEWAGTYLLDRQPDLRQPADNVAAGIAYLDYLYGRFDGDIELTLAAYYEGPRRVEERGPSEGGRRYAANVIALSERYG